MGIRFGSVQPTPPPIVETARLVLRPLTPDDLGDLATLYADPDRRRSMAALARTLSIARDATWTAAQFETLYRSLTL